MLEKTIVEVAALGGVALLITVVVNVLKFFNVVKDGDAPKWIGGFTLVSVLALYVTRLFIPAFDPAGIDATLFEIACVGQYILTFVVSLGISKLSHITLRGIPIIGKSFSLDRQLKSSN